MLGLRINGLEQPISDFVADGRPCSDLRRADRPRPGHLGLMDIEVTRNAYGRQVRSFEADVTIGGLGDEPLRAVFIRALDRVRRLGRRGARRARWTSVVARQGTAASRLFIRSSPTTFVCTRISWRSWPSAKGPPVKWRDQRAEALADPCRILLRREGGRDLSRPGRDRRGAAAHLPCTSRCCGAAPTRSST